MPCGSCAWTTSGLKRRTTREKRHAADRSTSVRGTTGQLHGELQHFAYRNISDHLETIDRYTTYAARQMHEAGRRASLLHLAGHPPLAFLRNYLARGGIRDRTAGFLISTLNAYYVFLKFAKLWELQRHTAHREVVKSTKTTKTLLLFMIFVSFVCFVTSS